jgi:streptogramin lyase
VPCTLAAVQRVARTVKPVRSAADNYPVPRTVRNLAAALASVAALLALPAPALADVTEFTTGLGVDNAPIDITAGPDGNLWFTEQGLVPAIGRITPTGTITEYPVGLLKEPGEITAGPDGALWFTVRGLSDQIGRIDPADGAITEFPLDPGTVPTGITAGKDGALYFGMKGTAGIGRITTAGDVTDFDAELYAGDTLNDVAAGADGKVWFTVEHDGGADLGRIWDVAKIGRLDPGSGDVAHFDGGLTSMRPNQIVAASDGKLYFTESDNPAGIGRIKTDGTITEYRSGITFTSSPFGIAEGGDGALWFTAGASPGRVGRLWAATHTISELQGGLELTPNTQPNGITRGPDGNVWFTGSAIPGRIGRITVAPRALLRLHQKSAARHDLNDGELKATVGPNSQATSFYVEYGPDKDGYDQQSEVLDAGSGADPVTRVVELDLEPSSHYHARLVATNASGEARSGDVELWTNQYGQLSDFDPTVPVSEPETKPETGKPTEAQGASGQTPAADHAAPIAPPVLGEAVVVRPLSGAVRVRTPGAAGFTALAAGANLPVGTLVDTRAGKIVLQSARDAHGRTQAGTFWGGVFQIRQRRRGRGMTSLHLRGGSFRRCGTRAGVSVLAHEAGGRRRVVRRLWGRDKHSRFRTHGRDSVAAVRGTRWVTTDRCDGTLTRVTEGKVLVRDLRRKRKVLLSAGSAYLARHRR